MGLEIVWDLVLLFFVLIEAIVWDSVLRFFVLGVAIVWV